MTRANCCHREGEGGLTRAGGQCGREPCKEIARLTGYRMGGCEGNGGGGRKREEKGENGGGEEEGGERKETEEEEEEEGEGRREEFPFQSLLFRAPSLVFL